MIHIKHWTLIVGIISCNLLSQPSVAQHHIGYHHGHRYVQPAASATIPVWQQIGMINPYQPQRPHSSVAIGSCTNHAVLHPHSAACPCDSHTPTQLSAQAPAAGSDAAPAPRSSENSVLQGTASESEESDMLDSQSSASDIGAAQQKRIEDQEAAVAALREILEQSKRENQKLQNVVAELQIKIESKHVELEKARAESEKKLARASDARAMAEAARREALEQMRTARAEELNKARQQAQRMSEQAQRMKLQAEKDRQATLARLKALEQRLKAAQAESRAASEATKNRKSGNKKKAQQDAPGDKHSAKPRPKRKGAEQRQTADQAPEKKTNRNDPEKLLKRSIEKIKARFEKKMQRVKEEGGDDVEDKLRRLEKTMKLQIKKLTERVQNRNKDQRGK